MSEIIHTLAYFDIFDHPLSIEEIYSFLSSDLDYTLLHKEVDRLVDENRVYKLNTYYSLRNDIKLVYKREHLERNAETVLPMARKYGNLIRQFPFVKAVLISGSLSKNVMQDDDDVDFFIVAKKNRIWLAKFCLKFYKYFYLKNSYKYFCINYFISEANLYIEEQNRYTATELLTLIPVGCNQQYDELLKSNEWAFKILPNYKRIKHLYFDTKIRKLKRSTLIEWIFWGPIGFGFDHICRYVTKLRNNIVYREERKKEDFELKLRSTVEQIKVHSDNKQLQTMEKFDAKIRQF